MYNTFDRSSGRFLYYVQMIINNNYVTSIAPKSIETDGMF